MSRLPLQTREALDDDGREVWDSITATRGSITTDQGALMGPFNAWVTAPGIGWRLAELGAALRFESSIERRLLEVAIITVGARWHAEFEWWAHSRMALAHGVSQEAVDAIARDATPPLPDDERVVHAVARQLVEPATSIRPPTTRLASCWATGASSSWSRCAGTTHWCRSPSTCSMWPCRPAKRPPGQIAEPDPKRLPGINAGPVSVADVVTTTGRPYLHQPCGQCGWLVLVLARRS